MNDQTSGASRPQVIVVGSINQDHFVYVREFPAPGATILAEGAALGLGGKGANQAIAAAALGARVALVGAVGSDSAGQAALTALAGEGVDVSRVRRIGDELTGAAYVTVAATGENTIVVSSGANAELTPDAAVTGVQTLVDTAPGRTVVLAQGELRADVVDAVGDEARRMGIAFVLNLAPVIAVAVETLSAASVLVLNEGEAALVAARLFGEEGAGQHAPIALVRRLQERLQTNVVLTLGADGAVACEANRLWSQPALVPARVVDTTGAGDAFTGALAAALADGLDLVVAVQAGVVAGSDAVEKAGTTTSYPRSVTPGELARRAPAHTVVELVSE
ncbi:MAG: ribokinase [Rhodoglobus sp.]|nr:ribokinase [Rhodoglobus sp.]